MLNVVVVVVVTTREGSFGSGVRFDCENLRAERFSAASSVVNELEYDLNICRCVVSCREAIRVAKRSCMSCEQKKGRLLLNFSVMY